MKRVSIIILSLCFISLLTAQNEIDALRYSYTSFGGTARSMGMAGSFGALGADFSNLSVNPAGMGLYKMSEFTLTPTIFSGSTMSKYNESENYDNRNQLNFNNIGFVFSSETDGFTNEQGWKNFQYGFGFNKLMNFNNRIDIQGVHSGSSILTEFVENSYGKIPDELNAFGAGLAFSTYLIDTFNNQYYCDITDQRITQSKRIERKGAVNEMVIAASTNYQDRFYIGGSLNFPWIRYTERSYYSEEELDSVYFFNALYMDDYLKTKGTGVNLKIGLLFRATDWFRLGGAIHTPTLYFLHDEYSRTITSEFDDEFSGYEDEASSKGEFDYVLKTPFRAIGSVAFIIGKIGLINADVEYVEYSSAELGAENSDMMSDFSLFKTENNTIRDIYKGQRNYRIGGELKLEPFSARAGFAYYGSPFQASLNDGSRTSYSLGFGYREGGMFLDVAYVYSVAKEKYYLYSPDLVNAVDNKLKASSLVFTVGFRY